MRDRWRRCLLTRGRGFRRCFLTTRSGRLRWCFWSILKVRFELLHSRLAFLLRSCKTLLSLPVDLLLASKLISSSRCSDIFFLRMILNFCRGDFVGNLLESLLGISDIVLFCLELTLSFLFQLDLPQPFPLRRSSIIIFRSSSRFKLVLLQASLQGCIVPGWKRFCWRRRGSR